MTAEPNDLLGRLQKSVDDARRETATRTTAPTPPPETAPETTRDLVLAEPLRDLAREFTFDADNAVRDLGGPDRPEPPFDSEETGRVQGLRFAASRLSDTVESLARYGSAGEVETTTEYRVTTTPPDGEPITFDARDFQAQLWIDHGGIGGFPPAVVECRTVTTVTTRSGWTPVPDDTAPRAPSPTN